MPERVGIAMRIVCVWGVIAMAGVAHAAPLPPTCAPLAKADRAAVKQRVLAWIDQQAPDEKASSDAEGMELVFNACRTTGGAVVDVGQDRTKRRDSAAHTRRNFVLRVVGARVEVIAARETTASTDWMEGANEGGLRFIAELDLDGDGAPDLVWSEVEHEGGAMATYDHLKVRLASGERPIAVVKNLSDHRVVAGQLVVAGRPRLDDHAVYACIDRGLHAARCEAAAPFQRMSDQHDRPAEPVPPAERHVAAFLASKQLDDPFHDVFDQPHAEATAFFAQLAAQLGDAPCTPVPLGEPVRAQLTAWLTQHERAPEGVALEPACGPYAWISWILSDDLQRREALMAIDGPAPVKIAGFTQPPALAQVGVVAPFETMFFQHGDTVVGVVIRDQNLSVIANHRVVAQSHGAIGRYAFDPRWHEVSPDVVVDGGTLFHPTPTGLEKLDRARVQDREAARRALERVRRDPPSNAPAYLAALRTLGAPAALIAECEKL